MSKIVYLVSLWGQLILNLIFDPKNCSQENVFQKIQQNFQKMTP